MIRTFFVTCLLAAGVANAAPQSKILAVVNKDVITEKQLNDRLKFAIAASGMKDSEANRNNLRQQILHTMIEERLQLQAAKEDEIEIEDSEVEEAITRMEESTGSGKGAARKLLQENGLSDKVLKDQVKSQVSWGVLLRQRYGNTVMPKDEEIDQEFSQIQHRESQNQYHVAEIVLSVDAQRPDADARRDAEKIRKDLMGGARFSAMAQQFSNGTTAAQGGDLGWLTEDQLQPEIKQVVQNLPAGHLSDPIKTNGGYSLVLLIEKQKPGEPIETYISISQVAIPYPILPSDAEKNETVSKLLSLAKSCKSCAELEGKVKRMEGGFADRGDRLPMSQVDPNLLKLIGSLGKGQVTKPLRSEGGVALIMVCDKEVVHPKKWTRDDAASLLMQKKMKLVARKEMRDVKARAFIELRS